MRSPLAIALLGCGLLGLAACGGEAGSNSCEPGERADCTCTDGTGGTQPCAEDDTFDPCECRGDPDGGALQDAAVAGAADAAPCEPEAEEWCDGVDNDCDGAIDDQEACPDDTVSNTVPFTRGVYFRGTTAEGTCAADALQQFYPALEDPYALGIDCTHSWMTIRNDGDVFYLEVPAFAIRELIYAQPDPLVEAPCNTQRIGPFGFDGSGVVHYQCALPEGEMSLRRGSQGAVIAAGAFQFVAVLADGRIIAQRPGPEGEGNDLVALGPDGSELSHLSADPDFTGHLGLDVGATTVEGDDAYVLFRRDYGQDQQELVAYRLTPASEWKRMRRVPVESTTYPQIKYALLVSDGTIFIRQQEPVTNEDRIVALLPDNTEEVIWREAEQTEVRAHGASELLVGPP